VPTDLIIQICGALAAIFAVIITWLLADSSFKAKIMSLTTNYEAADRELNSVKTLLSVYQASVQAKLDSIVTENSGCHHERLTILKTLDRLDSTKASKEVMDNFRVEFERLRTDLATRFDKVERLIERLAEHNIEFGTARKISAESQADN
jgi:flagellar biosynthesis/type III secretory pathway chaperone